MYVGVALIIFDRECYWEMFAYWNMGWRYRPPFICLSWGYEEPTLRRSFGDQYLEFRQERATVDSATHAVEVGGMNWLSQAWTETSSIAAANCSQAQETWSLVITAGGAMRT
jgi:hypothetical protein